MYLDINIMMCLNNILLTFLYSFNLLLFLFSFGLPSLELIEYFYDSTFSLLLTYDSLFYLLVAVGFIIYIFNFIKFYHQVILLHFMYSRRTSQQYIFSFSFLAFELLLSNFYIHYKCHISVVIFALNSQLV